MFITIPQSDAFSADLRDSLAQTHTDAKAELREALAAKPDAETMEAIRAQLTEVKRLGEWLEANPAVLASDEDDADKLTAELDGLGEFMRSDDVVPMSDPTKDKEEEAVMTGEQFRALSDAQVDERIPKLRVMARSQPGKISWRAVPIGGCSLKIPVPPASSSVSSATSRTEIRPASNSAFIRSSNLRVAQSGTRTDRPVAEATRPVMAMPNSTPLRISHSPNRRRFRRGGLVSGGAVSSLMRPHITSEPLCHYPERPWRAMISAFQDVTGARPSARSCQC